MNYLVDFEEISYPSFWHFQKFYPRENFVFLTLIT